MKQNRIGMKLLVMLTATALAMGVMELVIRALLPFYHPGRQIPFYNNVNGVPLGPKQAQIRQRAPKGDYDLKIHFNQYGLRDTKDLKDSSPEDWLVVGDSFSFGWGVKAEDRFSNQLEQLAGIHVYNVAMPTDLRGYRKLAKFAQDNEAEAKNLIIGVCMENDLRDYEAAPEKRKPVKQSTEKKIRKWFKLHSAAYIALSHELQAFRPLRKLLIKIGIAQSIDELVHINSYDVNVLTSSADMVEEVAANFNRTLVLIIPSRALWDGAHTDSERTFHADFVVELKKRQLNVLDLMPVFEESGNPLQFYFETDAHWNSKGHAKAGAELYRKLSDGKPGAFTAFAQ